MRKLFLLSPLAQKEETEKYCFGSCQKIKIGGIEFMDAPWLPCYEDNCPNEEKNQSFGKFKIYDKKEEIIVRKLKS